MNEKWGLKGITCRITKEGLILLIMEAILLPAATNSGKNLLFLMFCILFSVSVISIWSGLKNILGITLHGKGPVFVSAGETTGIHLRIVNMSRFRKRFIAISPVGNEKKYMIPLLTPKEQTTFTMLKSYVKRGYYQYEKFFLESGFPFNLVVFKRVITIPIDIVVYPKVTDVHTYRFNLSTYTYIPGAAPTGKKGEGEELFGLRMYSPGDSPRSIHWRSSAKIDKIMVREYESTSLKHFTILLDTFLTRSKPIHPDNCEKRISLAAGLLKYFLNQYCSVRMGFYGPEFTLIPHDYHHDHFYRCLDHMARIQFPSSGSMETLTRKMVGLTFPGESIVIIPLTIDENVIQSVKMFTGLQYNVDLIVPQGETYSGQLAYPAIFQAVQVNSISRVN